MESSLLDGDIRIGEFIVRPLLKTLHPVDRPADDASKLPDKAMAVLIFLAQHAGQVCPREDILDAVWGEDRQAYDRVLDNAIRDIRRALGDNARDPTYIQTISKRGYRLLVPAESQLFRQVAESRPPEPASGTRRRRIWTHRVGPALFLLLLTALCVTLWFTWADKPERIEIIAATEDAPSVVVISAARQALFADHPCGDESLLAPAGTFRPAGLTVELSVPSEGHGTMATLTAQDGHRQVILGDIPPERAENLSLVRFFADLTSAVDAYVCNQEHLPKKAQACHCLASTRTYQALGDPESHMAHLLRAIELDPDRTGAYEALASIYGHLGETEKLRELLNSGLERMENPSAGRALILRRRLAEALQDFGTEGELIERLQQLYPEEPRWILAKAGYLAQHRQDCEQALALADPLLREHPEMDRFSLEASASLWLCRLQAGRFPGETELALSPRDSGARFRLALGDMLSGRLDRAWGLANEVLALEPDAADSYWLLSAISRRRGAYAAAEHWLHEMKDHIRWPSQDLRYRVGLGQVALRRGGHTEECARRLEGVAVEGTDWNAMAVWTRGLCWLEAGRPDLANNTLEQLRVAQEVRNSLWLRWLPLHLEGRIAAAAAYDRQTFDQAANLLVRAVEFHPANYAFFATEAGQTLEQAGHSQRATEFYEKALAYNSTYPWAHCRLGLLELNEGHVDEALHHLHRALEVFGDPPEDPLGQRCAEALQSLEPDRHSESRTP